MSMTRRNFLKYAIGVSGILTTGRLSCIHRSKIPKKRPNIVVIYVDDLGYGDFSSYGGDIPTPNIDSIARQGIRFTDFYVSFPACTPSRYSLLTGCYPGRSRHGLNKVIMPGDPYCLDPCEKILPEFLKAAGYATGIFGKWHLGSTEKSHFPMHHGFDVFTGHTQGCMDYFTHCYGPFGNTWYVNGVLSTEEGYSTDLITNHAVAFIDLHSRNHRPFFAYVPYNAPHYGKTDPGKIPEGTLELDRSQYQGRVVINSLQAPQEHVEKFSHVQDIYRRYYSAMVSCLDDNIGRIIENLEKNKQMENTLIWLMSDNGGYSISFHGHASNGKLKGQKSTLSEGGIRVPAMVCWKGNIKPNQTIKQPVSNVDVLPTLASITDISESLKGLPIDGKDIKDVLFNGAQMERDLFWQRSQEYAMRRNRWKMVNGKELYDLENDIGEHENLAAQYPKKLNELNLSYKKFADSLAKYPCEHEPQQSI